MWLEALSAARETGTEDGSQEGFEGLREALRAALLAEDAAAYAFAGVDPSAVVPGGTTHTAQEALLHWLLLKRQVAAGGAGPGLVPEWESSRDAIDAALNAVWNNWLTLKGNPAQGDQLLKGLPPEVAQQAIMAAYWGLFPSAPVEALLSATLFPGDLGGLGLTIIEGGTPPVVGWSN
jgi:hypothetical protein